MEPWDTRDMTGSSLERESGRERVKRPTMRVPVQLVTKVCFGPAESIVGVTARPFAACE